MHDAAFKQRVIATIAEACRVDPTTFGPCTPLRELGLDSLSLVSVVALLESACAVELDQRTATRVFEAERVADLIAMLAPRAGINAPP